MKLNKKITTDIISVLFMILFLYTSVSKLLEYAVFKEQLAESPILAWAAPTIAVILPIVEIITAVALLVPRWRLWGFFSAVGLMIAFTTYIILIISFSNHLPCSCGGVLAELSWPEHIIFNGVFIGLGITGILLERKIRKEDGYLEIRQFQAT